MGKMKIKITKYQITGINWGKMKRLKYQLLIVKQGIIVFSYISGTKVFIKVIVISCSSHSMKPPGGLGPLLNSNC